MIKQFSYDPFDFLAQAEADIKAGNRVSSFKGDYTARSLAAYYAKQARDEHYRAIREEALRSGIEPNVHRSVLKNQLEQYQSFGVDGRGWRDVYYIDVHS